MSKAPSKPVATRAPAAAPAARASASTTSSPKDPDPADATKTASGAPAGELKSAGVPGLEPASKPAPSREEQRAADEAARAAAPTTTLGALAPSTLAAGQQVGVAQASAGAKGGEPQVVRHSITDPKGVEPDYGPGSLRKPAHRLLGTDAIEGEVQMPAPIAAVPYGSEPRSIDTKTGAPPAPEPTKPGASDADVTGGASAAVRQQGPIAV